MNTFKDKYIKYKKKYINLKKGGYNIDKYIKIVNEGYSKSNIVYTDSEIIDKKKIYEQYNYKKPNTDTDMIEIRKPVGLWYGIGSSWLNYVKTENFSTLKKNIFELEIDYTDILKLTNEKEVIDFNKEYKIYTKSISTIKWIDVAKKYKGIEINPYIRFYRYTDFDWYYTWDVSSGVVWDLSCIKSYKKINISKELKSPIKLDLKKNIFKRTREFITWNVCWECLAGVKTGLDARICKKKGKYICKDNILKVFTKLTRRPHFIALQEGNIKLGMEIIKILNSNSNSYNHKFEILYNKEDINKAISILIYDSTRFDLIFKYEGFFENEVKIPFDNKGRPYIGGLFKEKYEGEDFDFLINVSSIHRPHDQKLGFLIPQLEETYLKKFNSMFKTSIVYKKIFYNVPGLIQHVFKFLFIANSFFSLRSSPVVL